MPGRGDCDDDLANGCETDLESDADNRGECDKECIIVGCKEGACKR